jgi:hypothetical protein
MQSFQQFKDQIIIGLASAGLAIFFWVALSVTELNKNVAAVVAVVGQHEVRLLKLEGNTSGKN